ncbi:MAG: HAMP domain-containing protein [Holophagaceae bacterium]|nr:HAMP domain-containing protein [Holophagaceae bacterium]
MMSQPLKWLRSLHAKLFLVMALVTSVLTVAVAFNITRNSRRELETYSKNLTIEAARTIETEILERDPNFRDKRKVEEMLESIAGEDRSIFQMDVFQRIDKSDKVDLLVSSGVDTEIKWTPDLGRYMSLAGPTVEPVDLSTGNKGWKVYLPIHNPRADRPPIGLIRAYCDLERWETVWINNRRGTWKMLPWVILGEFILLWVILGIFVNDPLRNITQAMERLEQGDAAARASVGHTDELGSIANRFNQMASQLQRASGERESFIEEIRGLNANLQNRIDAALADLQAKNAELESLVERNSLLREELGQQERLAVAGQLTATFAHEVGTPLNLVNSHLQLLERQGDLTDKTRDRLGVIHSQIQRVGEIVRRLLDMTRRPQLKQEAVSLNGLVDGLQQLWLPTLAAHGVDFEVDSPKDVVVSADRKQMEQLFINLVNNAVDAMPGGGHIHLKVRPAGEGWSVELKDSGHGIPADVLPKVFKPMFTTKPEGKGTGLGLPICREIVRTHGGEIRLESEVGQGTTVIFSLPGLARAVA